MPHAMPSSPRPRLSWTGSGRSSSIEVLELGGERGFELVGLFCFWAGQKMCSPLLKLSLEPAPAKVFQDRPCSSR